MNETTLTHIGARPDDDSAEPAPEVWALVVAWYPDELQRVGEVFLLTDSERGRAYVLGRGPSNHDEPGLRLRSARQRPGRLDVTAPLASRLISRVQLRMTVGDASLTVENVGRAPLLHNDLEASRAEVAPGDTLQIGSHLLLVCVRRPLYLLGQPAKSRSIPSANPTLTE